MILTFEVKGTDIEIHFDAAGRDRLLALLSECREPRDHKHLFRFPDADGQITVENFDAGYTPAESVTLWMLNPDGKADCSDEEP